MLRRAILAPIVLLSFLVSFCQKEANIWYFGKKSGLDFSTNPPTLLTNGKMDTREGVAVMSDKISGQLIFYTEGTTVWNRNHVTMPNGTGLLGDYSSTQSSIIVPNPGDINKYYIFTTAINTGFRYSEVDISLGGGLGDIVSATKNQLLIANSISTEKLIAARHCNGKDFWVITHTANDNKFYVYLINSLGIQPPLVYSIGSVLRKAFGDYELTGCLKLSPDASKLANAIGTNMDVTSSPVELFGFNNSTGAITGPVVQLSNLSSPYGVEFSPNEKLLYVTEIIGKKVNQYDLTATNINASKINLISSPTLSYGALQLAPDGKIYVAAENGYTIAYNFLSTIAAPNVLGVGCNYQVNSVNLGSTGALIGLPTFTATFLRDTSGFTHQGTCVGTNTSFNLTYSGNIDSVKWDFGDASAISTTLNPVHIFTNANNYQTKLIIYRKCNTSDTIVRNVNIGPGYNTNLNASICAGSSYTLPNGSIVNQAGVYPVSLQSASGCDSIVTTTLSLNSPPVVDLGKDTALCTGAALVLTSGTGFTSYAWQDGSTSPTLTAATPGVYWLEVESANGCHKRDSINIAFNPVSLFTLGNDTAVCKGKDVLLGLNVSGAASYLWNTGAVTPQIIANTTGIYWLEVKTNQGCIKRDSLNIQISPLPQVVLGIDTAICSNQGITLGKPAAGSDTYLWSNGAVTGQVTTAIAGLYWQEVTNSAGCKARDSIILAVNNVPVFNLGKDTAVCNQQMIVLGTAVPNAMSYLWNTGASSPQVTTSQAGTYWLEVVSNNGCKNRDSVQVTLNNVSNFTLGKDPVICAGQSATLTIPVNGANYSWSNGSIASQIIINSSGLFWAEVSLNGCLKRDSVDVLVTPGPQVKAQISNDIDCGTPEAKLQASGAESYLWTPSIGLSNPAIPDPIVKIGSTATYYLKGVDDNGCDGFDSVIVKVTGTGSSTFNIANAFTPNGDGQNDCFGISKWGAIELIEFSVYNRFGNKVFTTKNQLDCWNGTYKGKLQDPGGFIYIIKAKSFCGEIFRKGIVMLVR